MLTNLSNIFKPSARALQKSVKQISILTLLGLILGGLTLGATMLTGFGTLIVNKTGEAKFVIPFIIVISFFAALWIFFGFFAQALLYRRGHELLTNPNINHKFKDEAFASLKKTWPTLATTIIFSLAAVSPTAITLIVGLNLPDKIAGLMPILILVGLLAIIYGIYISFSLYPWIFLIATRNISIKEAYHLSRKMTKGKILPLLIISVLSSLIIQFAITLCVWLLGMISGVFNLFVLNSFFGIISLLIQIIGGVYTFYISIAIFKELEDQYQQQTKVVV